MYIYDAATKFRMHSPGGTLVIAFKSKAKYKSHATNMLFCILKNIYLNKSCISFQDLLPYITSGLPSDTSVHLPCCCYRSYETEV